jgi:hypothetical protein
MAHKTYVVGLRIVLRQLIRYASRYQAQLSTVISTEALACLIATLNAANECLALVPQPETVD